MFHAKKKTYSDAKAFFVSRCQIFCVFSVAELFTRREGERASFIFQWNLNNEIPITVPYGIIVCHKCAVQWGIEYPST